MGASGGEFGAATPTAGGEGCDRSEREQEQRLVVVCHGGSVEGAEGEKPEYWARIGPNQDRNSVDYAGVGKVSERGRI